jgi:uncharacterized protein (TIGR00369 family)
MSADIPPGFEPSERTGPFFDLIGPVYTSADSRGILLGLRARTEHCNARGLVHAAILTGLLDVVCGRNCATSVSGRHGVTVSLSIDFLAAAKEGEWLEATATVARAGGVLAFADGRIDVDGRPIAKASAVFRLASE